jgi:hypothetical protein
MKSLCLLLSLSLLCISCASVSSGRGLIETDLSLVLEDRVQFKNWLQPQLVELSGMDITQKLKRVEVQTRERICFIHFEKEEIDWNGWSYEGRLNDCVEFIIHEYSCDKLNRATYDYESDVTCSEESRRKYLHNNFKKK